MMALFGLIFTDSFFLKEDFNNKKMHTKIKGRVRTNILIFSYKKPSKIQALY
ncbi:protein of unknown function [Cardinium endosymbiont cEper1 of Encarsia pergandiella]|nr:protein of unknown function [Cardinium endosymbiont cEper1 of Encarsia pergandiella]